MDSAIFYNQPWIGNNNYLNQFLDSLGYPPNIGIESIITNDRVKFRIPIKFWVHRRSNSTAFVNESNIKEIVQGLNKHFNVDNNTWLGFYAYCDIGYIDSDEGFNIETKGEARE